MWQLAVACLHAHNEGAIEESALDLAAPVLQPVATPARGGRVSGFARHARGVLAKTALRKRKAESAKRLSDGEMAISSHNLNVAIRANEQIGRHKHKQT